MLKKIARRIKPNKKKKIDNNLSQKESSSASPTPKKLANSPKPVTCFSPEMPTLQTNYQPKLQPLISIVLIVYKMPRQALNTLLSLSTNYQQGVSTDDYEVIVIENESDQMLKEEEVCAIEPNFRYFRRKETASTPVFAINFGAQQTKGTHICVMIDGARMITPGTLNYMLVAAQLSPRAVVSVPGYHLGPKLQQVSILEGYTEDAETELLNSISWPSNGYRLFDIACFSGTCAGGYFKPIGESNCICVPKEIYAELGGYDEGFTATGGGQVNLDYYKRAVELSDTVLFVLLGEGTFHQLHGGVTTGQQGSERKKSMEVHFAQYSELRGGPYEPPEKRAIYLGAAPDSALKFIRKGANKVITVNKLE